MKKIIFVFLVILLISRLCLSQDTTKLKTDEQTFSNTETGKAIPAKKNTITTKKITSSADNSTTSKFMIGFSVELPTGTWPATALTNRGTTSTLKSQGNTVGSYGIGIVIQAKISNHFSLFSDINAYGYNIFLAKKGADVQSAWTIEESAVHWDEPGAPQIQYVQNLPTDVYFDMKSTGIRLGGKFIAGNDKFRPWAGAAFGLYKWAAHYYNNDKSNIYGNDSGYATGLTFLIGIDWELIPGFVIAPFVDFASPVATYKMEGLFYPQWDIEYNSPVMGTIRIGLTFYFAPHM